MDAPTSNRQLSVVPTSSSAVVSPSSVFVSSSSASSSENAFPASASSPSAPAISTKKPPPPTPPQRSIMTTTTFKAARLPALLPLNGCDDIEESTTSPGPMPAPPAKFGGGSGFPMRPSSTGQCKMTNCGSQFQVGPSHCSYVPAPMSPISENSTVSSVPSSDATVSKSLPRNDHHSSSTGCRRRDGAGAGPPVLSPEGGFNSNCQQCLAERAAAEATTTSILTQTLSLPRVARPTNFDSSQGQGHQTAVQPTQASGPKHAMEPNITFSASEEALGAFQERRGSIASNNSNNRQQQSASYRPGRTYECEALFRESLRMLAGCIGICFLAAGYAAIGGFLFMAIESRAADAKTTETANVMSLTAVASNHSWLPDSVRGQVDVARQETVTKLWQVTEKMNILYPENWTRQAAEEIVWFQEQIAKTILTAKNRSASPALAVETASHGRREWTFARGLLYSVSLLTTVGEYFLPVVCIRFRFLFWLQSVSTFFDDLYLTT